MRNLAILISLIAFIPVYAAAQGTPPGASPQTITSEQLARLERAENRLKDWPNLGRYREANSKLSAPEKNEKRVVFMGDSITDGWKLDEYFKGMPYVNRGISGQTTPQMLLRFRPDVIDLKPAVVVILAGTNDLSGNTGPATLEDIERNLASMAELARAHDIRVVLSSVLPINDYSKTKDGTPVIRSGTRPPEKILALNAWMRKYADDNRLVYLDYFTPTVDTRGFLKEDLSRDGLHPNPKGYEIMKPLAEQAIGTALRQKPKKL